MNLSHGLILTVNNSANVLKNIFTAKNIANFLKIQTKKYAIFVYFSKKMYKQKERIFLSSGFSLILWKQKLI